MRMFNIYLSDYLAIQALSNENYKICYDYQRMSMLLGILKHFFVVQIIQFIRAMLTGAMLGLFSATIYAVCLSSGCLHQCP